jgi:hypothetical protein
LGGEVVDRDVSERAVQVVVGADAEEAGGAVVVGGGVEAGAAVEEIRAETAAGERVVAVGGRGGAGRRCRSCRSGRMSRKRTYDDPYEKTPITMRGGGVKRWFWNLAFVNEGKTADVRL